MTHPCLNGERVPTSYTHGRCKINAGKPHYASTCPFTQVFSNCPRFVQNVNYEQERLQEIEAAKQTFDKSLEEIE